MATKTKTESKQARTHTEPALASKPSGECTPGKRTRRKGVAEQYAKPRVTKLDILVALLNQPHGATIAELSKSTGWQAHSVRGALAGALKRKGYVTTSDIVDGVRRYRIDAP